MQIHLPLISFFPFFLNILATGKKELFSLSLSPSRKLPFSPHRPTYTPSTHIHKHTHKNRGKSFHVSVLSWNWNEVGHQLRASNEHDHNYACLKDIIDDHDNNIDIVCFSVCVCACMCVCHHWPYVTCDNKKNPHQQWGKKTSFAAR